MFGNGTTSRPDATNKDLTWEKTTTWNAGIDLGFLNNRLVFNVDWYYRKTKDLLNTVYIEAGSNFRNKLTSNIGSLHNTGIEFSTTIRPIQTKDFSWEVNYNVTYNENEIDELNVGGGNATVPTGGISAGTGGNIQAHATGHPASSFYVYQQVYDENGKPIQNAFVDRNGNGVLHAGEEAKVSFEIINNSSAIIYDVKPTVVETTGNKYIHISPSILVESIMPGKGVRYTATVRADKKLKNGNAVFRVAVRQGENDITSQIKEFDVRTVRE